MLGAIVGALLTGPLMPIGRWNILIIVNTLAIVGSLVQATCFGNFYIYINAKFVFGAAAGGFSAITPKVITEITPKPYQGGAGGAFQSGVCLGILASGALISLGYPAYPKTGGLLQGDNARNFLIWTPLIPFSISLLQMCLLLFVYRFDTPAFMKAKGDDEKLREVLAKIYKPEAIQGVIDEINVEGKKDDGEADEDDKGKQTYRDICCNPRFNRATWLGCAFAVFQQTSGVNILYMYS